MDGLDGVAEIRRLLWLLVWSCQRQDEVVGGGHGDLLDSLGSNGEALLADDFVGNFLSDELW